jgi:hypothetical protein
MQQTTQQGLHFNLLNKKTRQYTATKNNLPGQEKDSKTLTL